MGLGLNGSVASVFNDEVVAECLTSLLDVPVTIAAARASTGLKKFAEDAELRAVTVDTIPTITRMRTRLRLVLMSLVMERTAGRWEVILMDTPIKVEPIASDLSSQQSVGVETGPQHTGAIAARGKRREFGFLSEV